MFRLYHYSHHGIESIVVAQSQPQAGGCATPEESSRIIRDITPASGQGVATAEEAIATARKIGAKLGADWWDRRELSGADADHSGRTHDGSPIIFRIIVEADY
ncbi:MAG: hypothetical protein H3C26_16790 [Rhodocyclaceae bacterium]|nr:hypothetical protein [Rhodocyclaceae bacterium]